MSNYVTQMSKDSGDAYLVKDTAARQQISNEVTARESAIAAEARARETAIAAEVTARVDAVAAEARARETAIAAEVTARETAIAEEATSRESEIAAEASTREAEISVLKSAIDYIPYSLNYVDFVFNNVLAGNTTQKNIWFNNFMPASQYPNGLYCIVYNDTGTDGTSNEVAEVRVRYADSTNKTTIIYNIGEIVQIEIDNSKTIAGFDFIGIRSASISPESIKCSWGVSFYSGEDVRMKTTEKIITQTDFDGMFQMGAFNGNNKSWVQSTKGAVGRKNMPLMLSVGDKIYLTNYTGIHFRFMYLKTNESTLAITSWMTSGTFTVADDGLYWIEIETSPAVDVQDINDLVGRIRVVKYWDFYDAIQIEHEKNQKSDWFVKSINHRGMNLLAPENTLPAFILSSRLGWKYVETDVAVTSDGVIVLLHDETINRTARNADGSAIEDTININDITYEQACNYDFGIWKGTQYAGTKIPTLAEFLTLCRKISLHPYIDFGSIADDSVIENVINTVKRYGMIEKTTLIGININALTKIKNLSDRVRIGWITTPSASTIESLLLLKTDKNEVFMDSQTGTYTDTEIQLLANADIPLETYTPNNQTEIVNIDPYVSGITSDYLVAGNVLYNSGIGETLI